MTSALSKTIHLPLAEGELYLANLTPTTLEEDLAYFRNGGAELVVSLTGKTERQGRGLAGLEAAAVKGGLSWAEAPTPMARALGPAWHRAWCQVSPLIHQQLEAGGKVVLHGPEREAFATGLLRHERGEAIETMGLTAFQMDWLRSDAARPGSRAMRACLLGGAIGDALGAEIEFWSLDQILRVFPQGVDRILPHDGLRAAITDDTQMTLFTAEALIRMTARRMRRHFVTTAAFELQAGYLRWLSTQGETPPMEIDTVGLVADPRLHRRRAPGNTCLTALRASLKLAKLAQNDSKGCGGVMRAAPVGLLGRQVEQFALESAALTHGHEAGQNATRAFAVLVDLLFQGKALDEALDAIEALELDFVTRTALRKARAAIRDGHPARVEKLGGGWVAEEALAIAVYAALAGRDFADGLRIAVTHSGDSDSTGAMAGNLLGLLYPDQVLDHPWRQQIECADLICRLADDLAEARVIKRANNRFGGTYPSDDSYPVG